MMSLQTFFRYCSLAILVQCACFTNAKVISGDKVLQTGRLRFFYDDVQKDAACKNVLILGVGTGMRTSNYNKLSNEIVAEGPVVVFIVDHNPFWLAKTSERRYANMVMEISNNLATLVPDACENVSADKILIGGHSASGQAAWRSIPLLEFPPDGFVGLDPFRLDPNDAINIPTFNWGFTRTSCQVTESQAAKAGYQATLPEAGRIFVQTNNTADGLGHCDFTDNGCYGPICGTSDNADAVRESVGVGIIGFIESLYTGSFDRDVFVNFLPLAKPSSTVYINEDKVNDSTRRYLRGRIH